MRMLLRLRARGAFALLFALQILQCLFGTAIGGAREREEAPADAMQRGLAAADLRARAMAQLGQKRCETALQCATMVCGAGTEYDTRNGVCGV